MFALKYTWSELLKWFHKSHFVTAWLLCAGLVDLFRGINNGWWLIAGILLVYVAYERHMEHSKHLLVVKIEQE